MHNSQRIIKYDNILDIIFIGTKYTKKVEIMLTKFNTEFLEKKFSYG